MEGTFFEALSPVLLTAALLILTFRVWLYYKRISYISKIEWVMMEVRIPREIHRSPLAMELVLNAFHQTFPTVWYLRYVKGIVRSWFSLELVSIDGNVYFFLCIPRIFKNYIESQIYSQYPQMEINEVPDYTEQMPPYERKGEWQMFGSEFTLSKPDPYPIRTYIDYGLDRATGSLEEEEKIDPITPILEFLGSLTAGEQVWIQILVRATMKKTRRAGTWFGRQGWKDEGKAEIEKLKSKYRPTEDKPSPGIPTKDEQDVISALDRSIAKIGFDCGIRVIYLARADRFNNINIAAILGSFRQYGSSSLNSFVPIGETMTGFAYPWQDPTGFRTLVRKKKMLAAYRLRSYFNAPYKSHKRKPFVLNSEELATIYHFPGRVSETPSFRRVESKKSEPPANLPI